MLPYVHPSRCCGCGACVSACPASALSLQEDGDGFLYPVCDEGTCTQCGACRAVCGMTKPVSNAPLAVYAAAERDQEQRKRSTSGGMFAAFATVVLEEGGLVFGAALDEKLEPVHRSISSLSQLPLLQGSKYVQSLIGPTYEEARDALEGGRTVLFSGTPCQIAGLNGFLRGKTYPNLITVDLICHGTPPAKFFRDYRAFLEEKAGEPLSAFFFRDKGSGWGLCGKAVYETASGQKREEVLRGEGCSYYDLFLHGEFYRESCFACPFACRHRPADLTVGDFWGIEVCHPEWMADAGGPFDPRGGISSLIVNTENGQRWLQRFEHALTLRPSTFENAARRNLQLTEAPRRSPRQDEVRALYHAGGYAALDRFALERLSTEGAIKP